MEFMTELWIGIDIGKRHDSSAIVISLAELRSNDAGNLTTWLQLSVRPASWKGESKVKEIAATESYIER